MALKSSTGKPLPLFSHHDSKQVALQAEQRQPALLESMDFKLIDALQVALVDAFGFEDYVLNSALGRHDGDVYSALLDMAQVKQLS